MAPSCITSWKIEGKNVNSDRFYFLGLQSHCGWWLQPWNLKKKKKKQKKQLPPWKESHDKPAAAAAAKSL